MTSNAKTSAWFNYVHLKSLKITHLIEITGEHFLLISTEVV